MELPGDLAEVFMSRKSQAGHSTAVTRSRVLATLTAAAASSAHPLRGSADDSIGALPYWAWR